MIITVIGFSITGCINSFYDLNLRHPDVVAFKNQLNALVGGTNKFEPITVKLAPLTFSTANSVQSNIVNWGAINETVKNAQKYVILDLSDCTVEGNILYGKSDLNPMYFDCRNAMNVIAENQYIKGIILPATLKTVGAAFWGCIHLTSVSISAGVTSIDELAFWDCTGLTEILTDDANSRYASDNGILFNKDKTILEKYPLGKSGESYTIPFHVTSLGNRAFANNSRLTDIVIPNNVISIGNEVFSGCSNLENITISNSVTSIGDWAFGGCSSWKNISIPNSVTSIGYGAFAGCSNLESITIPNTLTSIDGSFVGCSNLKNVTIPNSVTSIGDSAFSECSSLENISIPNSVTSIGDWAFSGCSNLVSIIVDPENSFYESENGILFNQDKTTLIWYSPKKTETSYTIPNTVTSIEYEAFSDCKTLTNITIPDSVTSIGRAAFRNCSKLSRITIPKSVTSIGYQAFWNCPNLTSVSFKGSNTELEYDSFDYVSGYTSLENIYKNMRGGAGNYTKTAEGNWKKVEQQFKEDQV
jgi:hypothetical protein